VAERGSHGEEAQAAVLPLDEKGQALKDLLEGLAPQWEGEVSQALDEVVLTVPPSRVPEVCRTMREDPRLSMDYLRCLSVVDYVDHLQVVYHLYSTTRRHRVVIKANLPPDDPRMPTIVPIYPGANWHEREGHDLYGVVFEGHPNLKPLLLYEGFEGYPGRKSYPYYDYQEW